MNWDRVVVQTCTFIAVSAFTLAALRRIWSVDKRVSARLNELPKNPAMPMLGRGGRRGPTRSSTMRSKVFTIASRLLPNDQRERTLLQARLLHAGIYAAWAPQALVATKLLLIAVPPLVGFILGQVGLSDPHTSLLYGATIGGSGIFLPGLWLDRRKARRQAVLARSLPDFLDLMVTCIQSGLSLEASLQRVTDELELAHPGLAREMAVVQRQIELGATPEAALRNFAERTDLATLFSLSTLIEQARRFGTSVTDALRTQAEMLRYQREQRAEEMAQKAAVKILFPTLLCIFPAIFVVLVGPAAVQIHERFTSDAANRSGQ